ncbi:chemotaxis protein CheW [Alkalicoccus luteus]|uniref:Chemotaxis protein CheW n=1 Tax=Alkalicoccus luteus TaxID=1237094 RepID=A0A969PQ26_9BACI|nr:chemotaxis protein CheW [Alkalicoccus luteus]NJP36331.1 chemotaxis protein CheW [Alkalicoccus luteus]
METTAVGDVKLIVFQLQDEEYGAEVDKVRSIERMQHITRVPGTPDFVEGVMNLRGVVTPIIDLRRRFRMNKRETTDTTRIIIVQVGEMEVGLIVDSANDVIDIQQSNIEAAPDSAAEADDSCIRGVVKLENRLLILLHLEKVLDADELIAVENLEEHREL